MEARVAVQKKQNHVLHSLCAVILIILTAVKFDMRADIYDNLLALGRFAIPLFLIISGYFLYSEDGHAQASLPRKIRHILLMVVAAKILFLAIDAVYYAFGYIDLDYLIDAFLTSEETTEHIWFVYALLMMYAFWFIMMHLGLDVVRFSSVLSAVILAAVLFVCVVARIIGIDELFGKPIGLIGDIVYPFVAFPFFTIGYLLHKHRERFDSMFPTWSLAVLGVAGLIAPAIAAIWIPGSTLYFGSVVASVCLFMLTFRVPEDRLRCRALEFAGRYMKMYLYIFFPAVIFFMKHVALSSMNRDSAAYFIIGTFGGVAMNLALSYLAYRLMKAVSGSGKKTAN